MAQGHIQRFLDVYDLYSDMFEIHCDRTYFESVIDVVDAADVTVFIEQYEMNCRFCATVFFDVKGALLTRSRLMTPSQHLDILILSTVFVHGFPVTWRNNVSSSDDDTSFYKITPDVPQGGISIPSLFNIAFIGMTDEVSRNIQASLYSDKV